MQTKPDIYNGSCISTTIVENDNDIINRATVATLRGKQQAEIKWNSL